MTKTILIFSVMLALWSITPLASSNAYFAADRFTVVPVGAGDTVWNIAAKYVTNKDDIRELTTAIKQINHLNTNAQIYPGQMLKVPIKPRK
ncbi:Hypothetical protein LUCI_2672 [Lucifera butyrica]|uniref:LysM domain-containing protein n=1 Tax=Lucifera butyrica TaxID=1351585 RepID=A0A498RBB5_9FIRM|nr:LysM peptidoglycan-binding domain-containing protein [Lucifera butyrica]VBB07423.1 Hypothetical protein LUCI_2672 [Lucifera butyrica]